MLKSTNRTSQYQAILDGAFRKHFPGWDGFSEWDPMRLVAESLSGSLAAIEERQDRLVSTLLDTLPSLLAFEATPARLPSALLALTASTKATRTAVLPKGTSLRFHTDAGALFATLEADAAIEPIAQWEATSVGSRVELRFRHAAPSDRLRVHFVPRDEKGAVLVGGTPLLENHTHGFTRTGSLVFPLPAADASGVHTLRLEFDRPLTATWACNAFAAAVHSRVPEVVLGVLKGEPWERVALPEDFVLPPDSITLRFPDERTMELRRESEELLKVRLGDPERFSQAFFYNAVRHELILPACAEWLKGYSGGVAVHAYDVPVASRLSLTPTAVFSNEFPKVVSSASALTTVRGAVAREKPADYLERFYALVREIPQRPAVAFFPQDICLEIPRLDPRVRVAEYDVDAAGEVSFYLLLGDGSGKELGDECTEVVASVERKLRARYSLNVVFRVALFREQPLTVFVPRELSSQEIAELHERLQPPPLGGLSAKTGLPVSSLGTSVRLAVGSSGCLVSTVCRPAGLRFVVDVVCDVPEVLRA